MKRCWPVVQWQDTGLWNRRWWFESTRANPPSPRTMATSPTRATPALALAAACLTAAWPAATPLAAQVLRGSVDTVAVPVDSSDVLARARREQARFEARRVRLLPSTWWRSGGECEERVGRFCFWFGDEGRDPAPEPAAIGEARDAFLAYLDSVQALVPGEGWITGQRVWYRGEAGRWDDALESARSCAGERWWCAALRGLALHGLGHYENAEAAFDTALSAMGAERASRWRDPRLVLDGGARGALEDARRSDPAALERVWTLADPLLLAPGNDRLTEHYARWTVSALKDGARNPFGISWGRDMEELTVRMGWEVAWERSRDTRVGAPLASGVTVVGHHAPDSRDFFPSGDALRALGEAAPEELQRDERRPRTLYSPPLAPAVLPLEGQVAVFPRGDRIVVVATHYLPADTVERASRDSLRARLSVPGADTLPRRAGLFLVPAGGGRGRDVQVGDEEEGALLLEAPAGRWVVAVESWAPAQRRAGRFRAGLTRDTVPPDVVTLSDLLLVREPGDSLATLETLAASALVRPESRVGDPLAVAWEVAGLGWAPEEVTYELSVQKADVGVFRRLGQALGLVDSQRPLALSWTEPGPSRPETVLRSVALELGPVDPGAYVVTLRAQVPGRGLLTSRARVTLAPADIDDQRRPF
ncbi:MAG: hypothetical protein AMXMBFR53_10670 [Gemmatimonadota bacterium]